MLYNRIFELCTYQLEYWCFKTTFFEGKHALRLRYNNEKWLDANGECWSALRTSERLPGVAGGGAARAGLHLLPACPQGPQLRGGRRPVHRQRRCGPGAQGVLRLTLQISTYTLLLSTCIMCSLVYYFLPDRSIWSINKMIHECTRVRSWQVLYIEALITGC